MPLALAFNISQVANGACAPLPSATVDIWQCDALGRVFVYPGVRTPAQPLLRGVQMSGPKGQAAFSTIYPGWYRGRGPHPRQDSNDGAIGRVRIHHAAVL